MRVLITGGAGFIGSHTTDSLITRGDQVTILDDFSTGQAENVQHLAGNPSFELVEGTILDEAVVNRCVSRCDLVIHLAAAVGVKTIVEQPLKSLLTNVRGTENVLSAAEAGKKKVLVASTSEVYGRSSGRVSENADRLLGPTSIARWAYSYEKSIDEILAYAYCNELQVPTVIVRFFNTVGPRQSGAYGMVMPRLVSQALLGRELTIYGDGTQTRCFGHVSDVVSAMISLTECEGAVGDVFNIGTEENVSILELAQKILKVTKSQSKIRLVDLEEVYGPNFEDMPRGIPDTSKLRALTGWTPKRTLDEIITDVMAFAIVKGPENVLGGGTIMAGGSAGASRSVPSLSSAPG